MAMGVSCLTLTHRVMNSRLLFTAQVPKSLENWWCAVESQGKSYASRLPWLGVIRMPGSQLVWAKPLSFLALEMFRQVQQSVKIYPAVSLLAGPIYKLQQFHFPLSLLVAWVWDSSRLQAADSEEVQKGPEFHTEMHWIAAHTLRATEHFWPVWHQAPGPDAWIKRYK